MENFEDTKIQEVQQFPDCDQIGAWESCLKQDIVKREPSDELRISYARLRDSLPKMRPSNSNSFAQMFRIFQVPSTCILDFMEMTTFVDQFSQGITACYIFKFKFPHSKGQTHGICVRLAGFAPRRTFEAFVEALIKFSSHGFAQNICSVSPIINKRMSLFDYLQSLYVTEKNLLVNYSNQNDAIPQQVSSCPQMTDHHHLQKLTVAMRKATQGILGNICSLPQLYPSSTLSHVLGMSPYQYRCFMRFTTLNDLILALCQEAYNYALQDSQFTPTDIHYLMDPLSRRSLLNKFVDDSITKHVQALLQQSFGLSFVHPHPYINICKGDLPNLRPFDGMVFDPKFLLAVLMCGRWFAKTCMRSETVVTNNNAHLLLYGQSGGGKSLLLSVLSSNIPTYHYLTGSRFQNPEMLQSALLYIDELDTAQLTTNQYKALLDIKSPVKVDFKNLHPENVTQDMPCIISTNDDLFQTVSAQSYKRVNPCNQSSVDAAIRRLYVIPFKLGQYDKFHGPIQRENPLYSKLQYFSESLERENDKLSRMFNFIVTFSIFQTDVNSLVFDYNMQYYFQKLVRDSRETVFGMFYIMNKEKVDRIIASVEKAMIQPDINDTEYIAEFAIGVGELGQLMRSFVSRMAENNSEVQKEIVDDTSVPWHIRMYYIKSSMLFVNKVSCQCDNFEQCLNEDVRNFITDRRIQQFVMDDFDAYGDLDHNPIDSDDQITAIINEKIGEDSCLGKRQQRKFSVGLSILEDQPGEEIFE